MADEENNETTPEEELITTPDTEQPAEDSENSSPDPSPTILSMEEYGDHHVPIVVDGETLSVPLSEATSSFLMQSDYTRKTERLAREREQFEAERDTQTDAANLLQSWTTNPKETAAELAKAAGLQLAESKNNEDDSYYENDYPADNDTSQKEIAELKKQLQETSQTVNDMARADFVRDISNRFEKLDAEYGKVAGSIEPNHVYDYMAKNKVSVEDAYKAVQFTRIAERQELSSRAQTTANKVSTTQPAPPTRGQRAGAVTTGIPDTDSMSLRDIINASVEELDYQFVPD